MVQLEQSNCCVCMSVCLYFLTFELFWFVPSVLWHCWFGVGKSIWYRLAQVVNGCISSSRLNYSDSTMTQHKSHWKKCFLFDIKVFKLFKCRYSCVKIANWLLQVAELCGCCEIKLDILMFDDIIQVCNTSYNFVYCAQDWSEVQLSVEFTHR